MNITKTLIATLLAVVAIGISIFAFLATGHNPTVNTAPTPSAYVALLDTEVRGISPEDIEGYQMGAGLGFALPAELNGYPGPRHVLDLASELDLTEAQESAIQALYDAMLPEAIDLGEQILDAEAALELAFREETISDDTLQSLLATAETHRASLRYVHLRTHLATIEILTPTQVGAYNALRGYSGSEHSDDHSGH